MVGTKIDCQSLLKKVYFRNFVLILASKHYIFLLIINKTRRFITDHLGLNEIIFHSGLTTYPNYFNITLNIFKLVFGEKIPKMSTFSVFVTSFCVNCYNKSKKFPYLTTLNFVGMKQEPHIYVISFWPYLYTKWDLSKYMYLVIFCKKMFLVVFYCVLYIQYSLI